MILNRGDKNSRASKSLKISESRLCTLRSRDREEKKKTLGTQIKVLKKMEIVYFRSISAVHLWNIINYQC